MHGRTSRKETINFVESSKTKKDNQSRELQFGIWTSEILQVCNIGKENTSIHISTPKETK